MALNACEMWTSGIKIAFFSKKLQKLAQRQTPIASRGWGLRPHNPACVTFELR